MDPRIQAFVERAAAVQHSRELARALCKSELREIDRAYRTDASRKTRLTKYRNALRDAELTKYFLTALRLPKARAIALRVNYGENLQHKGEHPQPIHSHRALIDQALSCIESPSYSVAMLGLGLLSGRRPYELCVTGDFSEDENLQPPEVWFVGQAKTRHQERSEMPYAIPLLCERERFLEAWGRFVGRTQARFAHMPSSQFGQFAKTFGEAYTRYFAALMPPKTTVRNLRDAYALIAYAICRRPEDHTAINYYLKRILGHDDLKADTAQSYQKLYLVEFDRPQWRE